jgi:hypothetical protein
MGGEVTYCCDGDYTVFELHLRRFTVDESDERDAA